jgi:hypothetical protein
VINAAALAFLQDAGDDHALKIAACAFEIEGLSEFGGELLWLDTDPTARDLAVFHEPMHQHNGDIERNRKADTLTWGASSNSSNPNTRRD